MFIYTVIYYFCVVCKSLTTSMTSVAKWVNFVIENSSVFYSNYTNFLYNTESKIRKMLCKIIYDVKNEKAIKKDFS